MKIDSWLKENHKEIYDEYLSSLDTNRERERERERVILKSLSNFDFEHAIEDTGNPSLYNHIIDYYGVYPPGRFIGYLFTNLFENNIKDIINNQNFCNITITCFNNGSGSAKYSDYHNINKSINSSFVILSYGDGTYYAYPSFRLNILYKE